MQLAVDRGVEDRSKRNNRDNRYSEQYNRLAQLAVQNDNSPRNLYLSSYI
jgi:hypothetical protein